jgi:exocyst complex component 4
MSWRLSEQPLAKASTQLMALINSLCAMLGTSPFHRENYSRLILGVIIQFYQRCSDRYQSLISTPAVTPEQEPQLALGAQWAHRYELQACFSEMQEKVSHSHVFSIWA